MLHAKLYSCMDEVGVLGVNSSFVQQVRVSERNTQYDASLIILVILDDGKTRLSCA